MRRRRIVALSLWVMAALAALASVALARPGGGESFSGGGGHGDGGGGGGDGGIAFELIYWGFQLVFHYPAIGLPIVAIVIGIVLWSAYQQRQNKDWDSGPPVDVAPHAARVQDLIELDPDFSQVVFEDFAFRLFSTAHRARASADMLAAVAPYVSEAARRSLAERSPVGEAVSQVIVGALRITGTDVPPQSHDGGARRVHITVQFEANVATAAHTYYSVETWRFGRDASRTSKPPGAARTFPCPNCGAPWQSTTTGTQQCASCSQIVDNGRFDWVVEDIDLQSLDQRGPTLTSEVPERGTDLATYKAPDRDEQWDRLVADDPSVSEATFEARLAMIYDRLNKAWTANDLTPVRGLVSDGLYDYLSYWIDAYKRQGLQNQLTDMRITAVEYAKVSRDRWYDAIAIRIWGTGKDFVVKTASGQIVRGSKRSDRRYSEYWTFIRSASRRGAPKANAACGNCGAPLAITMAGACEHCGAYLASGDFDWVLSKIEQDDTYRG